MISTSLIGALGCAQDSSVKAAADARVDAAGARVDPADANARVKAADAHVRAANARVNAADADVEPADADAGVKTTIINTDEQYTPTTTAEAILKNLLIS